MRALIAIILFCLTSCQARYEHEDMTMDVVNSYSTALKESTGLEVYGISGARTQDVRTVAVTYVSPNSATIEEARKLVVQASEGLLARLNTDEEIRPYLHSYPFNQKNVGVGILFKDNETGKWQKNSIALAIIVGDSVSYAEYRDGLRQVHEESYKDAVKLAQLDLETK